MFFKLYFIALALFFFGDMLWVGVVAKSFYAKQIGFIMKSNINWIAVVLFYAVYVFALTVFVIAPAVEKGDWMHALLYGALFGLAAYGTYDFTNLATVKNWPVVVTVVDLFYGTIITAFVAVAAFFAS